MQTQQRIICQWCQTQNLTDATACHSCGAPLDVRNVVNVSSTAAPPGAAPALVQLEYRSADIAGDMAWATVATFQFCGQLHAARAVLSRANIVSRIGPTLDDSPEFDLQTASIQVQRARAILGRTNP